MYEKTLTHYHKTSLLFVLLYSGNILACKILLVLPLLVSWKYLGKMSEVCLVNCKL